jgi:hypothetical protein
MKTMVLILTFCVLTTSACNLRYGGPINTVAEGVDDDISYSAPVSTVQTVSAPHAAVMGRPERACTPRFDWPEYSVVAGDTLSEIALRANSSVAELAAANCLSDTRLIHVNQRLYVPQIPQ